MPRAAVVLFAGLIAASTADAADHGVYLGAAVSHAAVDVDYHNASSAVKFDGSNTKYKIIAGIRARDWLAFELNYVDFGSVDNTQTEYKLDGYDVFAVGLFQAAIVDLYAKAGGIRWNSSLRSVTNAIGNADDSGFDLAYGGGAQVRFGSFGIRAEYERFDVNQSNTDMISVGATWTFL